MRHETVDSATPSARAAVVSVPSRASVRKTRRSSQLALASMFKIVQPLFRIVDWRILMFDLE